MAQAGGVSIGYLSAIEKGGSLPSLPVLARLAHALDVALAEILRTSASDRLARGHLTDALGTRRLAAEGSRLQIVRSAARPGERGRAALELGGTDVAIFVYRGELELDVDGERFVLGAGDALHCDLPEAIDWRVVGDERCVSLWAASALRGGPARR